MNYDENYTSINTEDTQLQVWNTTILKEVMLYMSNKTSYIAPSVEPRLLITFLDSGRQYKKGTGVTVPVWNSNFS